MAQYLTVHVDQLRFDDVDPTGEPCAGCGEIPYLVAIMFRGNLSGEVRDLAYLCSYCADDLGEQLYG